ncbi:MAG: efflux RND transporter periplasmic adaptor subunit [Gammaproteobacteria bacterium]|nr:MAG: efflux RND transporter periplasmic adaptor subunit [Gammaproteobacteria bacterium]
MLRNAVLTVSMLVALSACGGPEEELPPPPVRPVKLFTVEGTEGAALRRFPGAISASQRAELSFRVNGTLQKILVKEGDRVKQGQVLAQLDPTDYQIRVSDRQATFDKSQKNFNRAKELIQDGNISQTDYDQVEANFRSSEAALKLAKQELAYTRLRAPFAGSIGRREVDNFEEVQPKQAIFQLQNVDQLDVAIDMSENLVRSLRRAEQADSASESKASKVVEAYASFEGKEGDKFSLKIKEVSTKADPQTQTFRVTFTMPQPKDFAVLPGMTANVFLDLSRLISADTAKWVPISAVVADGELDARVWVLDDKTMTVSARPVKIGRMSGRNIEVSSGLAGGEEIVSVGAAYLADGMQVSRMILTEQAEPRADDPS